MQQFLSDMIHLTEGEKLIKYWWIWITILVSVYVYLNLKVRRKDK